MNEQESGINESEIIEFSDRAMELKGRFDDFCMNLLDTDLIKANELQEKISEFVINLRSKYSTETINNYELYHVLVNSSLREKPLFYDFDDQDSIETFIDNLLL